MQKARIGEYPILSCLKLLEKMNMNAVIRFASIAFLIMAAALRPVWVFAQSAKDTAVLANATVVESPPAIILSWPAAAATSYSVSRKALDAGSWTVLTNALPGSATSYVDTDVALSSTYEYYIYKNGSPAGYGYVYAGIQAALTEERGALILLVDSRFTTSLATELARLERDLTGDGWRVIRYDVSSADTPANIKALILSEYSAAPLEVKALFLFGHIPQPYSGSLAPDGHGNHSGAWPADVYYAEMNGSWTDSTVNNTSSSYSRQHNIPGDGKFDQTTIPSPVELQVGRVDLYDLPAFAHSETELLRRYLDKDHKFRRKLFIAQPRMVMDDNFGYFNGEAFAASGWRAGASCFGAAEVHAKDYFSTLRTDPYLMSYGCGGGNFTSASGVGSTTDFATNQVQSVFTLLFGSYFGDWDSQNNFLRAPLASSPWALTCAWSGRPHWFMHHMALGLPIGHSTRVTQNNNNALYQRASYGGSVHIGLMGDPTLRLHPVAPPAQVSTCTNASGDVVLNWSASADTVEGYHVYRAPSAGGTYTRLTDALETVTVFVDSTPPAGTNSYMVRAVKLQESASGTYFNPSQGAFGLYPDRQLSLTVISAYGSPVPAAGVSSYSAADATVLCALSENVVDLGEMQLVAMGWRGTGSVTASGTALETPLINLAVDSSITWQWQTNFWLTIASDANGTVDLPGGWYPADSEVTFTAVPTAFRHIFSHWSGSGLPAGLEQSNPLTLPVDGAREVFANFTAAPNPDNALIFAETFENYPPGMPLAGTNGWYAQTLEGAHVSTNSALIEGVTLYGLTQPYPVNTTHAKVGALASRASLNVVSASNATVISKMLLKMKPYPESLIPPPAEMTNQLAFILSEAGELMLFHGTPVTAVKRWSTFTGTFYDADAWHTVTLEKDYATVGQGCRYFRISVDNGAWLTDPAGYTANDGSGVPGGAWFAFADPVATHLSSFIFNGTVGVDDILIGESWNGPGGSGDLDQDGMWDFWEFQYFGGTNSPAGSASADWDNDGSDNLSEWLADTSPGDTNSVLAIRSIALEGGGVRLSWQGGRAATQYLQRRDDLLTGSWHSIFTNLPPTDIQSELFDSDTAAPRRFYRIHAIRE